MSRLDLLRARLEVAENVPDGFDEAETVAPKSHKRRVVPFPRFLADDLAGVAAGKRRGDLVFTNAAGGLLDNSNFRRNVFDPACIGGRRAGAPEDCGGPWAFLELRQRYCLPIVAARVAELLGHLIAADADTDDDLDVIAACRAELAELHPWLSVDRYDRRAVNRRLAALSTPAKTPGRIA